MRRRSTTLEAEGAEFLVLGHLLVEGLQAYKAYTRMPGYDVVVVNPEANRVARVQVKSRWRASAYGIIIKNFDCDFVLIAKLNRGSAEPKPPEFFVIPAQVLSNISRTGWGKVNFTAIPNLLSYANAWNLMRDFVGVAPPAEPDEEDTVDP